jgi:hypothetical protein
MRKVQRTLDFNHSNWTLKDQVSLSTLCTIPHYVRLGLEGGGGDSRSLAAPITSMAERHLQECIEQARTCSKWQHVAIVWNIAPCSPYVSRRFGETHHLHVQSRNQQNIKPAYSCSTDFFSWRWRLRSSETSGHIRSTQSYIPKDGSIYTAVRTSDPKQSNGSTATMLQ